MDIRLPAKYTVRTGKTIDVQNHVERKVALPVSTQKGVDISFSSVELTMDLDRFAERHLEPAMAQLAADIEADALNMYKDVPSYAGTVSSQVTYKSVQQAGQFMSEKLAPRDNMRTMIFDPVSTVEFNDAVKGLFHQSEQIEKQYREGMMGRTAGFKMYENTLMPAHTPGTFAGTPVTNGASQGSTGAGNVHPATTTLVTDGWTSGASSLKKGDIITIGDVFDVHPESKVSLGRLKRFVVTEDISDTTGDMSIVISPAIISGGAYQNVDALAGDGKTITVLGTTATTYGQNLAFHRDAFIFATADLEDVSQYGAWGARRTYDGISLRVARQYDINNDEVPCRIDVLYGYVSSYPELAARLVHQQT